MNLHQAPGRRLPERIHGGPDGLGVPLHDFSSNSHACGPCPDALLAIGRADPTRYPDPNYTALRKQLAAFHKVDVQRLVIAASASEFIFRITAWFVRQPDRGQRAVWSPPHGYGDYAQAARAAGLAVADDANAAALLWCCDPSSPLGEAHAGLEELFTSPRNAATPPTVVLDRAYEPLRLDGTLALTDAPLQTAWQLWTPNKALGLTGVRGAYAIAPAGESGYAAAMALAQICPSWPVGSQGVALLQAWATAPVQDWLAGSLATLRSWKARQLALCDSMRWDCRPSQANFFCAEPALPQGVTLQEMLGRLRTRGIKLRDTASFGLPGKVRLSVQTPAAQDALRSAWQNILEQVNER